MGRGTSYWVKAGVAGALLATGALSLLCRTRRAMRGPRVHVLGFHRVVDTLPTRQGDVMQTLCVTTRTLTKVAELAAKNLEVLSLDDAVLALRGKRPLHRDAVVFTFDDGYRDVYLRARPVLSRLGLPATVFVPSGYVGSGKHLPHDRLYALLRRMTGRGIALGRLRPGPAPRPALHAADALLAAGRLNDALDGLIAALSPSTVDRLAAACEAELGEVTLDEGARVMGPDELRACAESGISVGAHTIDHSALPRETPERIRSQLTVPRQELEAITGRPCKSFAYCNGLWSPTVLEAVSAAGYDSAVTTWDRPNVVGSREFEPLLIGRKVLHEAHLADREGEFSPSLAQVHLNDLFGALGLTRAIDGLQMVEEEGNWRRFA